VTAKLPSWLKPKTKGIAQATAEGVSEGYCHGVLEANADSGFLDFQGWYTAEKLRRSIKAAAKKNSAQSNPTAEPNNKS
jgi:hypothetical protein